MPFDATARHVNTFTCLLLLLLLKLFDPHGRLLQHLRILILHLDDLSADSFQLSLIRAVELTLLQISFLRLITLYQEHVFSLRRE